MSTEKHLAESRAEQATETASVPPATMDDRKMEQIRDILFGGIAREYDRRFAEHSERLSQEIGRINADIARRIGAVEARLEAINDRLSDQLRQETAARAAALDDLDSRQVQALRTQRGELMALIERVDRSLNDADGRAREALAGVQAETANAVELMKTAIDAEHARIRGDKLGREDFADMMAELSMRLRGTLDLPKA